nr:MAG TPA: hypothetical protein [Caudoviricetes sp.]
MICPVNARFKRFYKVLSHLPIKICPHQQPAEQQLQLLL